MKRSDGINYWELLFFAGVGIISFLPFLGASPLFDWDEINFAEAAREMLVTGNYFQVQINYLPFWEKPPLFIWFQVLSMKLFGVNEYAARLPNAIIGIFTLCVLYLEGTKLRDNRFGKLVAGFYFASILPHLYFKSGIIDPTFNFFIFLGLLNLIRFEISALPSQKNRPEPAAPWKAGLWIGLATLTKGPVALLIFGLTFVAYKAIFDRFRISWINAGKFFLVWLLVVGAWFGSLVLFTPEGLETLRLFLIYQVELLSQDVAGHAQPFYYHFLVFLIGCFPIAAFAFRGMFIRYPLSPKQVHHKFMLVWFWVIMIVFSIVKTKIIHYSSMLYFPGAFLAAYFIYERSRMKKGVPVDSWVLLGLGWLVFGGLVSFGSYLVTHLEILTSRLRNPGTLAMFDAQVNWTGWEFVPAFIFALATLVGFWFLHKRKFLIFLGIQMVATAILLNGSNLFIAPKVSKYLQGAPLAFYAEVEDEDCYLVTEGYKSYAHYFYGRAKPIDYLEVMRKHTEFGEGPMAEQRLRAMSVRNKNDLFRRHLARGNPDKPVYLIVRSPKNLDPVFKKAWQGFDSLYTEGGYVFFAKPAALPSPQTP